LDWDANGRHCSVKECEINKKQSWSKAEFI
jgi:hypothetical protein